LLVTQEIKLAGSLGRQFQVSAAPQPWRLRVLKTKIEIIEWLLMRNPKPADSTVI
jgi:hypothetical protein